MTALGLRPRTARALQKLELGGTAKAARVVSVDRGRLLMVDDGTGPIPAVVSGTVRHRGREATAFPVTGDWVALDGDRVLAVLPRVGLLQRPTPTGPEPLVAHVDLVLVAHALAEDRAVDRLPRFTALAAAAGVPVVVLLTKADLLDDVEAEKAQLSFELGGAKVLAVSSATGLGLDAVRALIPIGTTAAVLGASGAGKSTLANALLGEDRQKTGAVREDDGRGRHITVRRDLLALPDGGLLIDTPGLRTVGVRGDVRAAFQDIAALAGECRFADCAHEQEPGCAVQEAIGDGRLAASRFATFLSLDAEAASVAARETAGRRKAGSGRRPRDGAPAGGWRHAD
ncbi:ribosome small subunit-dependent GTPase A [Conexibacter sp. W3-3-2]|uniref:Small ribosomal subunit biogenesis GTPase RsgA n=1 Tax=Paraconexibacter algicola TaxID=2133960 RepID=A0A2T4UI56_9ACTN|nr:MULTISPECIES: ribosome small subunit-dependent GTPase A [Solirubrobacterales]MTD45204.1 ribosome small subunit-dependent GTPase A [Conexibacter sp. W3-3-2]PTL58907.1 ribosome small subunit-dependent GTPase A [Paraconexibacter algicola]